MNRFIDPLYVTSLQDADDMLLDCRTPTLFVIGQQANTCTIDDMEDLREKMRAENSLIVVGGSDDNLRMAKSKKKIEAVTQMMVDKAILVSASNLSGKTSVFKAVTGY